MFSVRYTLICRGELGLDVDRNCHWRLSVDWNPPIPLASNCGWNHKIRRQVEFPQHPRRQRDEISTCSQFVSHARSPDPWDQPIADTCRIFVVAWEFFSEGSLLDLNTNREHSKQDTSPEKPPPGT
jgi:hypothetical protein